MKNMALLNKFNYPTRGYLAVGALALTAALAASPAAAANIGHARLAPNAGNQLNILIPFTQLSAADLNSLSVSPAPQADWLASGLQLPVDLNSIQIQIEPAASADARLVRVQSSQNLSDSIIDLLLDVKTASGSERHQVSVVIPPIKPQLTAQSSDSTAKTAVGSTPELAKAILVKPGDTMFAIAKRNAVSGVSIYQMMLALQRVNPQAFIKDNINLVRAGAALGMPSMDEMLSISDAEARRQFQAQVDAFNNMSSGASPVAAKQLTDIDDNANTAAGQVSANTASAIDTAANGGDKLKLDSSGNADTVVSQKHAIRDAQVRVTQLEHNVKNLNQALRSQGKAASDIVSDGAQAISESINQITDSIMGTDAADDDAATAGAAADQPSEASDSVANTAGATGASDQENNQSATDQNQADDEPAAANQPAADSQTQTNNNSDNATTGSDSGQTGININAKGPAISVVESDTTKSASTAASADTTQDNSWLAWINNHLLGFITGVLALIVLVVAWLLHRANANKDEETDPLVAEAMLEKKLNEINLDLDQK